MDLHAKVGDHLVVDNDQLGAPRREGLILEVLGADETIHYRVRWEDGHESLFFPASSAHVITEGGG